MARLQKHPARVAALASGALTYETGEPCSQGHIAPRRTNSSKCLACEAQANANSKREQLIASNAERARAAKKTDKGMDRDVLVKMNNEFVRRLLLEKLASIRENAS